MAYRNLYTPLSQFVDPQSTEIAQELRAKYLTSFQAQDQVAQALSQLPVASFENDQKIYNDLYNSTRAEIDGLASRGDYENMFVPVSRLARTYKNTATPLETNYNRYQADVETKKEMLDKGEITMSDYEGWLKKSRLKQGTDDYTPYLGIELDGNGRAVQSSYYGGTPIAQYVDIQKEILTQLNQIPEVKRGGYKVKEIQAPDADGLVFAITHKDQIVEYVPQEAVDAVTANIVQRPDVQAYMTQSADFNTLDLDENELDTILRTAAQSYMSSEDKDEQRYGDQLAHIISTQTVGGKRRAVKAMLYNEDINRYMTTARLTRQPSAYGGSYSVSYESALTNKLNETRGGGAGAYTPVLPGDNVVTTNSHLIGEGQTAPTIAGVEGHIGNIGNNKEAVESALMELHPELADIYGIPTGPMSATGGEGIGAAVGSLPGANSFESIQDDLYKENGVEIITTKLLYANPELAENKAQIENHLRQARADLFNYDAQRDAAEKIIKNAYAEFKDTFVNEVIADISNDIEMPAQQLPTFYNNPGLGQIGATYNPETNEVEFKQSGTFDPDAYKLGVAANIMTELEYVEKFDKTLSRSGLGGSLDVGAALFSQMFGLDAEEAMALAQTASTVTVTGTERIENLSQGSLLDGVGYRGTAGPVRSMTAGEDRLTGMTAVGSMGKINIREKLDKATEQAEERIGKLGRVTYTTSQSEAALGDSDGKLSKEINDTVKGRFLSTLANVPVILTESTRTRLNENNPEIANQARAGVPGSIVTIADLYKEGDEDYAKAKIARADFTSYLDPVTGSMKAGMSIETSTGDQILVPYDELIMGYDPTMPSKITNTYNSPGGMIASKAIATMLQYPTAFGEENGYVHRDVIGGRSVEIEFLAPQMPLEEDGLAVTAGPNRVIVRASGGAGEDVEQELAIDDFIIFYNAAIQ